MLNVFWFRRDLRLEDNAGLYQALNQGLPVMPVFIFDELILSKLDEKADSRIIFIYSEVKRLKEELEQTGSSLLVRYGKPEEIFTGIIEEYEIKAVFTNHDYEPYARGRDKKVNAILNSRGINFKSFKDQVIFEKDEVVKDSGEPYTIFTPYARKWRSAYLSNGIQHHQSERYFSNFIKISPFNLPPLSDFGFKETQSFFPSREINDNIIKNYTETRDFPAIAGTSRLGVHLRFGTISIRELVKISAGLNEVFLNELIWREFYMMILWYFPHVEGQSFKPQYDMIEWQNNEKHFEIWCKGMTGYPIVDAGMRELNHTGYMHNRSRMITASFLTKHLLIDWRWGEAYFAKKLLDFELASNNGGWQWAAGTGCDAAPYFRVFNPALQAAKFDRDKKYIMKWVPEFGTEHYPQPVVNHAEARNKAISTYKNALGNKNELSS